jgi:rsbT co-antagonist protein RsbR
MSSTHYMTHEGPAPDPSSLRTLYDLSDADCERIRAFRDHVIEHIPAVLDRFYGWLSDYPEFEEFLSEEPTRVRVKELQAGYWRDFFAADVDQTYVAYRDRIGETHARLGIGLNIYFAAMSRMLELFGTHVETASGDSLALHRSLSKLVHLDTSVVVSAYSRYVGETMSAQSKSLMEMSTPVTQIWSGVLLLPIVGLIDSKRAQEIMNATLSKISETQASIFILDISGVAVVDTAVANYLIKVTKATRLMGCECLISGVSPAIAQTIVELGIDVGRVRTTANLRDALETAFRRVGVRIEEAS